MDTRGGHRALVVAAAGLLVGACASEGDDLTTSSPRTGTGEPESGTVIDGDGWQGVLMDAHLDHVQLDDGTVVEDVESFVPSEQEARQFEEQLAGALPEASNPSGEDVSADDLDGYLRQYTGVEGGGTRQLVVSAFCEDSADDFPDWERQWVVVDDGGACYWEATMDLATGEIIRLRFNGSA